MREGWTYKKLGDVCESELGKTLNSSKDTGSLKPYLCAVNVYWDGIHTDSLKLTRFEDSELERYSVKKGDLLICEGGDIGRAAIWEKDYPIQYQNALHRVRFNGEILPKFCLAYLRYLKNNGALDSKYGKGVTIKHLVKSSLLSIPIPLPSLMEQQRIVAELDVLTGIIDKQKAQLKDLDTLANSIFYDMFGNPTENVKGWEVKKLEDCINKIPKAKQLQTSEYNSGSNYPIISQETRFISGYSDDKFMLVHIERPVIIFGDHTRVLKYVDFDFIVGADGVKIISPKSNIEPYFLLYFLKAYKIPNLGYSRHYKLLKEMNVIIPPLSLQQSFAEKIEAIERQKGLVARQQAETETLLAARMQYWFG